MLKFQKIGKYKISAIKYESKDLIVYIGFLGENPPERFYLINQFRCESNYDFIFKDMFLYFDSENKIDSFKDFFVSDKTFCMVFDYEEEPSILYKYKKSTCITSFHDRVKFFEILCVKLYSYMDNNVPLPISVCSLEPSNIIVNSKNEIFINFNFEKVYETINDSSNIQKNNKDLMLKISKIFKIMFEVELSSKYNRIMQFIFKQCELGIYKSMAEVVLNLKNNYEEASISSFIEYWKYWFKCRKYLIPRITKFVLVPSLAVVFVWLIVQKLNGLKRGSINSNQVTIGEITYSAGSDDKQSKSVKVEDSDTSKILTSDTKKVISIPRSYDIEFDDYVIQQGDTPSSLSKKFYNDESLGSAITSFNELSGYLIPGTLIRIPDPTAVKSLKNQ